MTLRNPINSCCEFARPKKCMLRQWRLKMGMLRLCTSEMFERLCPNKLKPNNFEQLKNSMLRNCTIKVFFLRLCANRIEVCNRRFDRLDPGSQNVFTDPTQCVYPGSMFWLYVSTSATKNAYVLTGATGANMLVLLTSH